MLHHVGAARALFAALLLALIMALQAACGGGGGGGGGGLQVHLDSDHVTMAGLAGAPLSSVLTATVRGDTSSPVYVQATADHQGISSVQVSLQPGKASLYIFADSTLAAGVYSGTLTVSACSDPQCQQHVGGSPFHVPYSVTYYSLLAQPANQVISVLATTVAADLGGSVPVRLAQSTGPARTWTATTDAAWLKLDVQTGGTGATLPYHVTVDDVAAQDNGTDRVATVTLTPDLTVVPAVQFTVTLRKRLPDVRYIAPGIQITGSPRRVYLRGVGYDALTLSGLAPLSGIQGVTVSRNSDTELQLDLPAAPAGSYTAALTNALGLPVSSGTLRLMDPVDLPAAVIEESGDKVTLLYDSGAQVLYLVEGTSIVRLAWESGTTWSRTAQSVPNLVDIGLSPDGSELVALTDDSTVRLLDPVTLAEEHAYPSTQALYVTHSGGAPVTGDGRVWLGIGGSIGTLGAFDLAHRTFETADMSQVGDGIYDGPRCVTARDGERLIVIQSSSVSPTPPLLYLDSRDSVLKLAPAGTPNPFYESSLGDDGRRMLLGGYLVLDADFGTVATLALPTNWNSNASVLSPDGNRAYVLSLEGGDWRSPYIHLPRIYVFDTSTPASAPLAPIGEIDLEVWPNCLDQNQLACYRTGLQISIDGRTLFATGSDRVIVTPVSAASPYR